MAGQGTRARFEKKVAPVLAGALESGEQVVAASYAMVKPKQTTFMLVGALATLGIRHYWVAVTDRRLVLLKMAKMGTTPAMDQALPLSQVRIMDKKRGLLDLRLTIRAGQENMPLTFPLIWRTEGEAISGLLVR